MLELQVAMKLAPDRAKFMEVVGGSGDVLSDIEKFCTNFSPLLEENHKFLVRCHFLFGNLYLTYFEFGQISK